MQLRADGVDGALAPRASARIGRDVPANGVVECQLLGVDALEDLVDVLQPGAVFVDEDKVMLLVLLR